MHKELYDYEYNLKIKKERDRLRVKSDILHKKIWDMVSESETRNVESEEINDVFNQMSEIYEQTLILTDILRGK